MLRKIRENWAIICTVAGLIVGIIWWGAWLSYTVADMHRTLDRISTHRHLENGDPYYTEFGNTDLRPVSPIVRE